MQYCATIITTEFLGDNTVSKSLQIVAADVGSDFPLPGNYNRTGRWVERIHPIRPAARQIIIHLAAG